MNALVIKRSIYNCRAAIRQINQQKQSRRASPELTGIIRAYLSTEKRRTIAQGSKDQVNVGLSSASDRRQHSMKAGGDSWIDTSRWIPEKTRPYLHLARVDKQVGTLLLLWPCFWSVALAAPIGSLPEISAVVKFAAGAFVMRGAGCTINDLWDKDFDKYVERTRSESGSRYKCHDIERFD
jgi:UbiA prenyltransferase family